MTYQVEYSPRFIRMYRNLETALQDEVDEKVELLKESKNHTRLKVHKLTGRLNSIKSFSVNYRIRITFSFVNKSTIVLERVGTHDEVY
jgi:addiction module RelE/StbE family toxin